MMKLYNHSTHKKGGSFFLLIMLLVLAAGCSKVLDKRDLTDFNGDQIFNDSVLARGYLSYLYDQDSPGWPSGDWLKCTDEIAGETKYFDGTVQVNTVSDYGVNMSATNFWGKLRGINMFLKNVKAGTLNAAYKKRLDAQALFFRAYLYSGLVKLYGGIPLVLAPQDAIGDKALNAAYVARSKTSQCIAQMVSDLDSGIVNLPGRWSSDDDWGRITSGAAAALEGRILLYWASPQFNPSDLQQRYQAAYDANKKAIDILTANGYGLNPDFQKMWFEEVGNPEAVWSVGYNTSDADQLQKNDGWDNSTRPAYLGTDGGSNQPISMIVNAFPMADGKKPGDPTSAYAYNPQLFYKNRGPRFYGTIAYNGCTWPINGNKNYRLWTYYVGNTPVETKATSTGFYCRKAIDPNLAVGDVQYAGTDWMEIRFAEVVLNLAESACGINKLGEAYQGLEAIRKRAGIPAGADGLYGLQAGMSRSEMFKAILYERRIEFAFEGKRYWDMRRWKLFEGTLNDSVRTGITIDLDTAAISPSDFAAARDTMNLDEAYSKYFTIQSKVLDTKYKIDWQPNYYFFAIPQQSIDNNTKLLQTKGWPGGTFDPLQ
jgi:hypothetical protein